ncbi:hypothetical protein ACFPJ1_03650 [Kribbella qitaiheensis]|uniref:hypothetical protein n=1 Tax=Kribbella qitaiheensis TaxID=1544730 RepID=UPI003606C13F
MRSAYRVLAGLISLGVLVQAMSIALAWFTVLKDIDGGAVLTENSDRNFGHNLHSIFGIMVIPLLAILLLIVSFFAGVAGGVKWAAIVFGLVVLQIALAFVAFGVPAIGALHGANALALIGVAGIAARRASGPPTPATTGTTPTQASI